MHLECCTYLRCKTDLKGLYEANKATEETLLNTHGFQIQECWAVKILAISSITREIRM